MIPNLSATSPRIIIKVIKKTIPKNCEIDFENENKEQAQKTKDNLSKSNYNLIKSEEELKKLLDQKVND